MELYYKDLISEETSLEKLVDELMLAVQGADECVSGLDSRRKQEIISLLERLKHAGLTMKNQAVATARATDKMLRQRPYSSIGLAFVLGLIAGALLTRHNGASKTRDLIP